MLSPSPLDSTIVNSLKHDGLLREGHFAYRSGHHSAAWLDRDRLLADPAAASRMGYALAKSFFTAKIDTVAAPSIWGAGLAQWVAYFLEPRARVVYSTPLADGSRRIADNLHDLIQDQRVLLIDNLILSGETIQLLEGDITALGGEVLGIGCLWASGDTTTQTRDVFGLLNSRYPAHLAADCPICKAGHVAIEIVPY